MLITNVCFHGIGRPGRELEPGEDRYWVGERLFLELLDRLAGRPDVRLSFDDGNASDVSVALPALRERGLRATFFLVAGRVGQAGSVDESGVQALAGAGMGFGTHGMRHRSWRGLGTAERREELVEARELLARVSGSPVDTAACPLGRYDRRVLANLRRLGYRTVYTSDRRPARSGAWLQPRFSVRGTDTAGGFLAVVDRTEPWPERVVHAAKGTLKRWR